LNLREIGEYFGMQRSAISELSRRFRETIKGNQELRKVLSNIDKKDLLNVAARPLLFLRPLPEIILDMGDRNHGRFYPFFPAGIRKTRGIANRSPRPKEVKAILKPLPGLELM
jgi:hypothetical protein